jgi:hypothetical protein
MDGADGGEGGLGTGGEGGSGVTDGGVGGSVAALRIVGDYVGINGLIDDPIARLAPIGNVREYQN